MDISPGVSLPLTECLTQCHRWKTSLHRRLRPDWARLVCHHSPSRTLPAGTQELARNCWNSSASRARTNRKVAWLVDHCAVLTEPELRPHGLCDCGQVLDGHCARPGSAHISEQDGSMIATGCYDGCCRFWYSTASCTPTLHTAWLVVNRSATTGGLIRTVEAHKQVVTGISWHPIEGGLTSCS